MEMLPDITITLCIFSGRPNPTWNISCKHKKYAEICLWFPAKRTNVFHKGLGYGGFKLTRETETINIYADRDAEKTLLEIMWENKRDMINTEMYEYIQDCIKEEKIPISKKTNSLDIEIILNLAGQKTLTWTMPPSHRFYKEISDWFGKKATKECDVGDCYHGFTIKRGNDAIHIMWDKDAEETLLFLMRQNNAKITSELYTQVFSSINCR